MRQPAVIPAKPRHCPGAAPTWPHCCQHNGASAMVGKIRGRLIKPLTMIKRSLPTGFPLICQTDRMPAGGAAWGFFGESLNERIIDRHALWREPRVMSERSL